MWLVDLRILQVYLNIVERSFPGSDLANLIPAIIFLSPAIEIPQPDITIVNGLCAYRRLRPQDDRRHMFLIAWTTRIDFLDGETSFPPTHMQKTIVRHTPPHVLDFRINGEDIPRTHRGQVGNAKIRLHRAKLLSRSSHERIGINRSNSPDNEKNN